jgi:predicted Zn-dependent protease
VDAAALEKMLANGRDSALLRLSLGEIYRQQGRTAPAVRHLEAAVRMDPVYSAAWKSLGRALAAAGRTEEAVAAFESGIAAAVSGGDKQAEKEMRVFLGRLERGR